MASNHEARLATTDVSAPRDRTLTVLAVLFGLLAVSNFLKPLQLDDQTGFVFLGRRLSGTPNAVMGPLFGAFLAIYAAGIWRMKRYALPMAYAYAAYVVVNLILWGMLGQRPPGTGYMIFGLVYMIIAIGVSAGAAVALTRRKAALS